MREYVIENAFVKAVHEQGGVAYKLTSQTANGLPDRLVLFFPAKTVFVELKAPGKMLRPLQRKRRYQLMRLGFPVLCIDRFSQIKPAIEAIKSWTPGTPFPEDIGAKIPELEITELPELEAVRQETTQLKTPEPEMTSLPATEWEGAHDLEEFGETLEPEDPSELAEFVALPHSGHQRPPAPTSDRHCPTATDSEGR